jgi:SPP1 family predicted phage head-tail adaptor
MRAGALRHWITIRESARTPDEGAGFIETWYAIANVYAAVEPLTGDEQIQAMQTGMIQPHRFSIRYRRGLTGANEILYDGRRFNVRSVVNTGERDREIVMLADEVRD